MRTSEQRYRVRTRAFVQPEKPLGLRPRLNYSSLLARLQDRGEPLYSMMKWLRLLLAAKTWPKTCRRWLMSPATSVTPALGLDRSLKMPTHLALAIWVSYLMRCQTIDLRLRKGWHI